MYLRVGRSGSEQREDGKVHTGPALEKVRTIWQNALTLPVSWWGLLKVMNKGVTWFDFAFRKIILNMESILCRRAWTRKGIRSLRVHNGPIWGSESDGKGCGRRKVSRQLDLACNQHGQGWVLRRRRAKRVMWWRMFWVRRTSIKRDKQEENIWQGNKFSLENIEYRLPWILY